MRVMQLPGDGRSATGTGVGLRLPHIQEVVTTLPAARWLEVHPENFIANPHAAELLLEARRHYPISLHTVGVSVGSACGVDRRHLSRVRALADRVDPCLVSGHLAWSMHEGEYLNDLLPLPYTDETLCLVARHIDEVQDGLGRRYFVENPSNYFGFVDSTISEPEFLGALAERTGCGLLCDVSNIYVSGHNMGYDPYDYIDRLPAGAVGELHLGGFTAEPDDASPDADILIDTHAARVAGPVWALYDHALRRFGAIPTLIEWDNEIPSFATLLAEAMRADQIMARALAPDAIRAVAC
jgi:hypothetical protein